MHNLINRTFKAIPRDYYISKLLVGLAPAALLLFGLGYGASVSPEPTPFGLIVGALLFSPDSLRFTRIRNMRQTPSCDRSKETVSTSSA